MLICCVTAFSVQTQQLAQASGKYSVSDYRLDKIKAWRQAALNHLPGKTDSAAITIGGWSDEGLDLVVDYLCKLAVQSPKDIKRVLAREANRNALGLTVQEAKEGNLRRLLHQGVMLHTDVALRGLTSVESDSYREQLGAFHDGKVTLETPPPDHWEYARRLLDAMSPFSSGDAWTKQWYLAATVHLLSKRHLFYAEQNLKRALQLFPSDDRILFYAGVLHELYASPPMQNAQVPSQGIVRFSFKSGEPELEKAKSLLEKAVQANPNFAEARLHLGRVLMLLNYNQSACTELQYAASVMRDPPLLYYASLNLGHVLKNLSRFKEARVALERAAQLFPNAQSPLLELSHLASLINDPEGERTFIEQVFNLPRAHSGEEDPWWIYSLSHVRDAAAQIEAMYRSYGALAQ